MLIYFLLGSLPWLPVDQQCVQSRTSILHIKQTVLPEILCRGLPNEMSTLLTYIRTLSFAESPDYNYIRLSLQSLQTGTFSIGSKIDASVLGEELGWSIDPTSPPSLTPHFYFRDPLAEGHHQIRRVVK